MKFDSRLFVAVAAVAGIALAAASGLTGPSDTDEAPVPPAPAAAGGEAEAALPEGHPDISEMQAAGDMLVGVVRETLEGGGYTYARLETDDGELWAAGPVTELSEGETVTLVGVMDMGAFTSPSLDRSFDRLYFADRFAVGEYAMGDVPPATGGSDQLPPDAVTGDFAGTVTQVISVPRYVYLEVETGDGPVWLAASDMEVEEGDEVRWSGGTLMRDFASTTLDRTFDAILFVGRLEVVEG